MSLLRPVCTDCLPPLPALPQEYLDRHESHVPQAPSKRPFLCVLSPDTLQLASRHAAALLQDMQGYVCLLTCCL